MLVQICTVIKGYVKMWWSISDATCCDLVCHFKILTTFCHKLWSITEQKYSNMEFVKPFTLDILTQIPLYVFYAVLWL